MELLQQDYWDSVGKDNETESSDLIKQEQSVPPETDLYQVKCEETESKLEVIHIEISKDDGSDYNDDNSCDQGNSLYDTREVMWSFTP